MANRQKQWVICFLATAAILLLIFISLGVAIRPRPVDASTTGRFKDLKELQDFVDSQTKIASLLDQSFYYGPVMNGVAEGTTFSPEMSAAPNSARRYATIHSSTESPRITP